MSYIDRNLLPDEKILFRAKKHLIIFFLPVVVTLFAIYASQYMHGNSILMKVEVVPSLVALIFWARVGLEYATSDYAVTNKRVMMSEGFFHRHANEMRLASISQVNIDQSLLARILNYGTVSINAFGAFDSYMMISRPFLFQKFVNQQLDTMTKP